ncbi:ABC transporter [Penicillium sp. IBT 35674x]|nr:ABC transporter [Penicillium sp. IBT 35674x]
MEKDPTGLEHPIITDDNATASLSSQDQPDSKIEETKILPKTDSEWALSSQVVSFHKRNQQAGFKDRKLDVTWKNLQVEVLDAGSAIHENVLPQLNPSHFMREFSSKQTKKTILGDSHGCVNPGEMLLVLGRPGSGCTTLLNILANKRACYPTVTGDVFFGSMNHKEAEEYPSHIVMQEEEEVFFPTLKVGQTVNLATRLKVPSHRPGMTAIQLSSGVHGNFPHCGYKDVYGLSTIVTLYQPGNNIVGLFDKVPVLDEGKQIYYGPMGAARCFMESLGFYCTPGANVADFLTGVTVPNERRIRPGFEYRFPRTADDILVAYQQPPGFSADHFQYNITEEAIRNTDDFRSSIALGKYKQLPSGSAHTVSFPDQVMACTIRQYQVIWGDKQTLFIKPVWGFIQA